MSEQQHNPEFCEGCRKARAGAPVPYDQLDPEMVEVVRALNTVEGIRTIDCCFGHPGEGKNRGHQTHAYVGMLPTEKDMHSFNHFWQDFFEKYDGKIEMRDGYAQFTVVHYPYEPYTLIRLHVECQHDPSIDPRGIQEKKDAFLLLQDFINKYNQTHKEHS